MKYKLTASGVLNTETNQWISHASGSRQWKEFQRWVAAGNTPAPEFDTSEIETKRKAEIKQNAGTAIGELIPDWKQRNALADALAIIAEAVDLTVLSEGKQKDLRLYRTQWESIKNIRLKSNAAETNGIKPEDITW